MESYGNGNLAKEKNTRKYISKTNPFVYKILITLRYRPLASHIILNLLSFIIIAKLKY